MPPYLTHVMEGRARLRHSALNGIAGREKALAVLTGASGVLEARPGSGSILLILAPDADLESICRDLESALPELRQPARGTRTSVADTAASGPFSFLSGLPFYGKSCFQGMSPRRLELRALLAACGLSAALGFAGNKSAHLLAGAAFGLLAARHVWTRRGAL
ncbi:hypothetical protein [uncultured Desulfovibrio sp.]|uniref:hypothetical protein n=1 Tax=uncultured Desulfovibrio sp. TaxID=167968 RepID=UPI002613DF42|nr:hypothetical protein [uncultured Desulfovibrio sp.]